MRMVIWTHCGYKLNELLINIEIYIGINRIKNVIKKITDTNVTTITILYTYHKLRIKGNWNNNSDRNKNCCHAHQFQIMVLS